MKNPIQVLHNKEQEITRVKKEIDALRIAVQLLGDDAHLAKPQPIEMGRSANIH